jgi:hypothetical protein
MLMAKRLHPSGIWEAKTVRQKQHGWQHKEYGFARR